MVRVIRFVRQEVVDRCLVHNGAVGLRLLIAILALRGLLPFGPLFLFLVGLS